MTELGRIRSALRCHLVRQPGQELLPGLGTEQLFNPYGPEGHRPVGQAQFRALLCTGEKIEQPPVVPEHIHRRGPGPTLEREPQIAQEQFPRIRRLDGIAEPPEAPALFVAAEPIDDGGILRLYGLFIAGLQYKDRVRQFSQELRPRIFGGQFLGDGSIAVADRACQEGLVRRQPAFFHGRPGCRPDSAHAGREILRGNSSRPEDIAEMMSYRFHTDIERQADIFPVLARHNKVQYLGLPFRQRNSRRTGRLFGTALAGGKPVMGILLRRLLLDIPGQVVPQQLAVDAQKRAAVAVPDQCHEGRPAIQDLQPDLAAGITRHLHERILIAQRPHTVFLAQIQTGDDVVAEPGPLAGRYAPVEHVFQDAGFQIDLGLPWSGHLAMLLHSAIDPGRVDRRLACLRQDSGHKGRRTTVPQSFLQDQRDRLPGPLLAELGPLPAQQLHDPVVGSAEMPQHDALAVRQQFIDRLVIDRGRERSDVAA